jgi:hypothetical protein
MNRTIHIFINKKKFDLDNPIQTGASLKHLAGILLNDVLFLQQPHEDEVIPNDKEIALKNGDHLHSQPPADYGLQSSIPSALVRNDPPLLSRNNPSGRKLS